MDLQFWFSGIETLTGSSSFRTLSFENSGGGTINVNTGGQLNLTNNGNGLYIGSGNSGTNSVVVNGGSITSLYITVGDFTNNNQLIINSGTVTSTAGIDTGYGVDETKHGIGNVVQLNGGVLATARIGESLQDGATTGTAGLTLAFNGGTLRATANWSPGDVGSDLVANTYNGYTEMAVTAGTGGAIIDSGTFSTAIMRPINNAASQVGTLTKVGTGALTIGPVQGYTGLTTITSGSLVLDYSEYASGTSSTPGSILPSGAPVSIAGGATLSLLGRPNGVTETSAWGYNASGSGWQDQLLRFSGGTRGYGLSVGESVTGANIPAGAYIVEIDPYDVYISVPPTATTTGNVTFTGTTFNPVSETFGTITLTSGTGTINVDPLGQNQATNGGSPNANPSSGISAIVTGAVTGPGALQKTGGALLTLSASGNYTGGTIVAGGTLQIGNTYALGATTNSLAVNAGTLDLFGNNITVGALSGSNGGVITTSTAGSITFTSNSTGNGTYNGAIQNGSGMVGLTQAGSGTLTLGGSSSYTGATNINAGILAVSSSNALGATGTLSFGGGTLRYVGINKDYSAVIQNSGSAISIDTNGQTVEFHTPLAASNSGGLTVLSSAGNGTLILAGTQLYTGATTISSGTLQIGDGTTDGSISSSTTVADNNSLVFDTAGSQSYTGAIGGTGVVSMAGSGVQNLSGSSSYNGGTTLSKGTLNYSNVNALGTGAVTFTGASKLQAGVIGTLANNIGANSSVTGTFDTQSYAVTLSGGLFGAGTVAKVGAGTLTLTGSGSETGVLSINAGIVSLGSSNALPTAAGTITFAGGTLQYSASNTNDYSSRLTENGSPISIDTNSQNITFASSYQGTSAALAYGFTKNGLGTLLITGNENNLSGPITINAGILQQGYQNSYPWVNSYGGTTTPMYVAAGATFDLNGNSDDSWEGAITGGGLITNSNAAHGATLLFGGTGSYTFSGSFESGAGGLGLDYRGTGSTMTLTGSSNIGAGGISLAGNAPGDAIIFGPGSYMLTSQIIGNSPGASVTINGGEVHTPLMYASAGASEQLVINSGTLVNTANYTLFADSVGYATTSGTDLAVQIGSGATINNNGFTSISQRPLMNVTGSSSAGTLTVTGAGSLNLSGTGTYTGNTYITGGGTVKIRVTVTWAWRLGPRWPTRWNSITGR